MLKIKGSSTRKIVSHKGYLVDIKNPLSLWLPLKLYTIFSINKSVQTKKS